jgi:hypothetical protein
MGATLFSREKAEVDRWSLQEGRLAGLVDKERDRLKDGCEAASNLVNDFFANAEPGLPLPQWQWRYGCLRGRFAAMPVYAVGEWAERLGDGWIEAERTSTIEVAIQADCWRYGQRMVVFGYVDLPEIEGLARLRWGRSL